MNIILYETKNYFKQRLSKLVSDFDLEIQSANSIDELLQLSKEQKPELVLIEPPQEFSAIFKKIVSVFKELNNDSPMLCLIEPENQIDKAYLKSIDGLFSRYDTQEKLIVQINSLLDKRKANQELIERSNEYNTVQYNLRQQLVLQQTMYEAAKLMNSSLAIDEVLSEILDILVGILEVKSLAIVLVDTNTNEWEIRAANPDESLIGQRISGENQSIREIIESETGSPILVESISSLNLAVTPDQDYTGKGIMCIPLISRNATIGAIFVTDRLEELRVERRDINIIIDMASQISNAVKNAGLFSKVEELAVQDGLTKLFNRAFFQKSMQSELTKAKRYGYSLSVIILDIDFFKGINDTYGHQIGDEVLKKVANLLATTIRKNDIAVRYGGEEMIGILIGASCDDAFKVAEKVRKRIESLEFYAIKVESKTSETKHMLLEREKDGEFKSILFPFSSSADGGDETQVEKIWEESFWLKKAEEYLKSVGNDLSNSENKDKSLNISRVKITTSVGVSSYPEDFGGGSGAANLLESTDEKDLLIYMADKALYKAKKNGRNRSLTYQGVQKVFRMGVSKETELEAITELLEKLKQKDGEAYVHSIRVSYICEIIAKQMKLSDEEVMMVKFGGLLHDIGKLFIEDTILLKPGKLTDAEYEKMKRHPALGAEFLEEYVVLHKYINGVRHHHEQWAGGGYPEAISGTRIPLEARIIAVADSFDAMTTCRRYRSLPEDHQEYALSELKKNREVMYDKDVVTAFFEQYEAILTIQRADTLEIPHN